MRFSGNLVDRFLAAKNKADKHLGRVWREEPVGLYIRQDMQHLRVNPDAVVSCTMYDGAKKNVELMLIHVRHRHVICCTK